MTRKELGALAYRVDRTLSKGMDHGLSDAELEPLRAQKRTIEALLREMRRKRNAPMPGDGDTGNMVR